MDLSSLNENQRLGVTCLDQYIKVVAGAGSGKTRVLTYRIGYLINDMHVPGSLIMGVTFTNKAAHEIKDRVASLTNEDLSRGLFLGTIHSWCARFLRANAECIDYPRNFTILDEEDRLNVMKDVFEQKHSLKRSDPNIKECLAWISNKKTMGLQYKDLEGENYQDSQISNFKTYYKEYTEELEKRKSLDFDDLLLKAIEILETRSDVRERCQRYSGHILVDEFQDINDVQFKLIILLMSPKTNLYIVGDPDQTIYTWRGANHRLILDLQENLNFYFKGAKVTTIMLERNYRSTKAILDVSNRLIKNNKERLDKNLFTLSEEGDDVSYFNARTLKEEAQYVVSTISDLHKKNVKYKDIAVLYRNNFQSREVETTLGMYRIPYKVFGGMKFYQRKEIKDIVSYFKLMVNPLDDTAFERIINVPKRAVGPSTSEKITLEANKVGQSKFFYLKENINDAPISPKQKALFITMFKEMDKVEEEINLGKRNLSKVLDDFVINIGYYQYLKDEDDAPEERIENVKELIASVDNFLRDESELEFGDFINNAMLQASQDEVNDGDYVSLLTVHTAKGLEYDYVFVYGMGEGIFPSARSVAESRLGIEEERRLAYVAFTRAKKRLYVSSNQDYSFVSQTHLFPSRFIKEAGLLKERNYNEPYTSKVNTTQYYKMNSDKVNKPKIEVKTNGVKEWNVGDRLTHDTYGPGVVKEVLGGKLLVITFDNKPEEKKTFLANHYMIKKL